jgi:RNA-directed DNA polymerase
MEPTDWNSVNWRTANRNVRNLRRRIFRATQQGDFPKVASLQKLMLRSYANRLLAVRRVTQTNQGKRTPGVDKVLIKTPTARGKLVDELGTFQPWRAQPTKRVYIPKASGKKRPLGIPTIRDRALQAMVKNMLEPSWEARFEATSYGFRPGRSGHDATERLFHLLNAQTRMKWVVDADIEGAFDNIDHDFLLQTIGEIPGRELIRQWLKAGYMDEFRWHPTDTGTPQGGVISPLLANIALHGMEEALNVRRIKWGVGKTRLVSDSAVVRYADDFVVTCTTREEAERVIDRLQPWLEKRGLRLSEEKTRIVHIKDGFDFLGFNLRQYDAPGTKRRGVVLLTKPSRDSVVKIRKRLKDEWLALRGHNVNEVTTRLNPIIRGWANYFRPKVSYKTFQALDEWMFRRELRYVKYRHPNKPWSWQKDRYWGRLHRQKNDNWVFGDTHSGVILLKFSWFNIQRHVMVKDSASPDDPMLSEYWIKRNRDGAKTLSPSRQKMARRQAYVCEVCGDTLFNGEEVETHHRIRRSRGGKPTYENLTLQHLYCHDQSDERNKTMSFGNASDSLEPDVVKVTSPVLRGAGSE